MNRERRYKNAYVRAQKIIDHGEFIKKMGLFAGIAICVMSLPLLKLGGSVFFIGLMVGFSVGSILFNIGIMISANGELIMASLDTAKNTFAIKNILLSNKGNIEDHDNESCADDKDDVEFCTDDMDDEKLAISDLEKMKEEFSPQQIYEKGFCPECGAKRKRDGGKCDGCQLNFSDYAKTAYLKRNN